MFQQTWRFYRLWKFRKFRGFYQFLQMMAFSGRTWHVRTWQPVLDIELPSATACVHVPSSVAITAFYTRSNPLATNTSQ